jgi:hypothetical protein
LPGALSPRLLPDFVAETLADSASDILQRLDTISPRATIRQGSGHHRSRKPIPSLWNLDRKGLRRDPIDLRRTAGTWANPAREPTILDLKQPCICHLVQMEGREP